jgi:hypothetical protein
MYINNRLWSSEMKQAAIVAFGQRLVNQRAGNQRAVNRLASLQPTLAKEQHRICAGNKFDCPEINFRLRCFYVMAGPTDNSRNDVPAACAKHNAASR